MRVDRGRVIDAVDTVTGFRSIRYADGMIRRNDRVMQRHGHAQRPSNEWPAVGRSIPSWISDFSSALVMESGGNLIRWMHITPSKPDIVSADRVGLSQAMPAGDAGHDGEAPRRDRRTGLMRDAMDHNRDEGTQAYGGATERPAAHN